MPTLVFVPGSWHKPACYDKIIKLFQDKHNIRCVSVALPSTFDNPNATFKDDIDAARNAITSETTQGRDVIVIAHSYGGMVGNSAIKGLTQPKSSSSNLASTEPQPQRARPGYVKALVLIASGFTITGLSFMDPLFGIPPPSWRVDKESGYAVLIANPHELFYHDVPADEADYWVNQLTTQSLKALFEGREHAYAGWQDVPTWYIGTVEDRGLPVVLQRVQVGMARGQGGVVHHTELKSSHSPFLSLPEDVVEIILDAIQVVSGMQNQVKHASDELGETRRGKARETPNVIFRAPYTWFRFGIPFFIGRVLGWGFVAFMGLRKLWTRN